VCWCQQHAGVIAEGSVDPALCGKHFKHGICRLQLFYETLIHHAVEMWSTGISTIGKEVKEDLAKLRQQMNRPGQKQ
jgi:hypothetical protein